MIDHQIVIISAKQGAGKSTLTNALRLLLSTRQHLGIYSGEVAFAEPLYEWHDQIRSDLAERGVEIIHKEKDGDLLQMLGDWCRKTYGADIFVNLAKETIAAAVNTENPPEELKKLVIIISDCRFKNELQGFPEALRVRLECAEDVRKKRALMWREKTTHQSEIDLDHLAQLGAFDMTFHTDDAACEPQHLAELISAQLDKNCWVEKRKTVENL